MKNSIAFFLITVIGMTSSTGYAAGWNVDIFAGKQESDKLEWAGGQLKTDSGRSRGIGISKQITPRTSVGFEVGYTRNEYSGFKPNYISGTTAMITTKYDFLRYGRVSAYGGLGLGYARVKYQNAINGYQNKDSVAAGQVTLGARMAVTRRSGLFLEARHIGTFRDPKIGGAGGNAGAEYKGNSVVLGWRYRF